MINVWFVSNRQQTVQNVHPMANMLHFFFNKIVHVSRIVLKDSMAIIPIEFVTLVMEHVNLVKGILHIV